jgi:hypothetical protein
MQEVLHIRARKYEPAAGDDEEKDEPGERDKQFVLPPLEPGRNIVLHTYLDKPNDEFPLDDEAWLVVGTTRKAKVLIVGRFNPVLGAFFDQEEGTKKIATAERMNPDDLKTEAYRKKARSGEVDLVIFDRCAPEDEADLPTANTFFIDRPPPPWKRGTTLLKNPLMIPSKQSHALMRHLTTISEVHTHEAFVFVEKKRDQKKSEWVQRDDVNPKKQALSALTPIIETSNEVPLLFTMPRGPYTDLVMTFPLMNDAGDLLTNWPLQTSFPLFFRNVLYILGNVDDSVRAISVSPGEPVVLRPEAGVTKLTITTPKKDVITLERGARPDFQFADTEQVGVYRFDVFPEDKSVRSFAVNLLDANESNIEPRKTIRIGNERTTAGQEKSQPRDIWKWILILAVVLLVAEWYIYHRRIAI